MLLSRKWRNLALGMLTVTILCNVLVLKQMPDSPSRSISAIKDPKDLHNSEPRVSRDSTSRKLGFTNSTNSKVTKRWVYSIGAASERHSNSKTSQSSGIRANKDTTTQSSSSQSESSEQLYMSHPRFGQQSSAARSSDGQATTGIAAGGGGDAGTAAAAEKVGNIAGSLHGNASEARPQNLVQLSEAFRQQQVPLQSNSGPSHGCMPLTAMACNPTRGVLLDAARRACIPCCTRRSGLTHVQAPAQHEAAMRAPTYYTVQSSLMRQCSPCGSFHEHGTAPEPSQKLPASRSSWQRSSRPPAMRVKAEWPRRRGPSRGIVRRGWRMHCMGRRLCWKQCRRHHRKASS